MVHTLNIWLYVWDVAWPQQNHNCLYTCINSDDVIQTGPIQKVAVEAIMSKVESNTDFLINRPYLECCVLIINIIILVCFCGVIIFIKLVKSFSFRQWEQTLWNKRRSSSELCWVEMVFNFYLREWYRQRTWIKKFLVEAFSERGNLGFSRFHAIHNSCSIVMYDNICANPKQ